jgi:hypothetical protein
MAANELLYEEKQFMGHNRLSIVIRSLIAIFCFLGYYWSENPNPVRVSFVKIGSYPIDGYINSGRVFFIVGIGILVLSAGLTYVLHIHTKVYRGGYIIVEGFYKARKVKINFNDIHAIRKSRYKKNIFRRAVYNVHNRGIVRFYTSGEDFIELADSSGFVYRIGSHKSHELFKIIKNELKL